MVTPRPPAPSPPNMFIKKSKLFGIPTVQGQGKIEGRKIKIFVNKLRNECGTSLYLRWHFHFAWKDFVKKHRPWQSRTNTSQRLQRAIFQALWPTNAIHLVASLRKTDLNEGSYKHKGPYQKHRLSGFVPCNTRSSQEIRSSSKTWKKRTIYHHEIEISNTRFPYRNQKQIQYPAPSICREYVYFTNSDI